MILNEKMVSKSLTFHVLILSFNHIASTIRCNEYYLHIIIVIAMTIHFNHTLLSAFVFTRQTLKKKLGSGNDLNIEHHLSYCVLSSHLTPQ